MTTPSAGFVLAGGDHFAFFFRAKANYQPPSCKLISITLGRPPSQCGGSTITIIRNPYRSWISPSVFVKAIVTGAKERKFHDHST